MEYKAIYKCRLCGDITEVKYTIPDNSSFSYTVAKINAIMIDGGGNSLRLAMPIITHTCMPMSHPTRKGFADLIGVELNDAD